MELDTSWITNFEKLENEYNLFYKDKITEITIFFLYVNRENDVIKIKRDKIDNIKNNTINSDNLLYLIKNYNHYNDVKYKLISLLKFNIDIDSLDINNFLREKHSNTNSERERDLEPKPETQSQRYLNKIENINSVRFNNTINIFQDLNSIILIYYPHEDANNSNKSSNANDTNNANQAKKTNTRRVYLKTSKWRKTKRKQA